MNRDDFYQHARKDITGPLSGVKVVELTTTWSGPMAGCVLADLGAEVLRIEHPMGDITRHALPDHPQGSQNSVLHANVNRNKRAITLDLHLEEAQTILRQILETTDILIENFKPGTLDSWSLGYKQLNDSFPSLVYVSISGFGQFGSLRDWLGYDPLVQMMSGWAAINGQRDDPFPLKAPTTLGDDLAGLHAAIGCLGALLYQRETGEGQHVDVSMLDCMLFQSNANLSLAALGHPVQKSGNEFHGVVPANTYSCAGGQIYIGVLLDKHWNRLVELMEDDGVNIPEGVHLRNERVHKREQVNLLIEDWCAEQDRDGLLRKMTSAGIPAAPVLSFQEVAEMNYVVERDMLQDPDPDSISISVVGPPAKFSRTPTRVRTRAPQLSADTSKLLRQLGMEEAQIQSLAERGVVAPPESGVVGD